MDLEEARLLKRKKKAETSGKVDDFILSCRRLAEYHVKKGQYDQALAAFREELRASELKQDEKDKAHAHRMIGEMCSTLGLFEESLEHANKYLSFAKNVEDTVEEQRAWATIGRTYFCWAVELQQEEQSAGRQRLSKILKHCRTAYMKSLCICEEELRNVGNRERQEMKARLLFNLGLACEVEGELSQAQDFIYRAVAICKKDQLFEDLHRCLLSLVTINMGNDNTASALKAADEALEVSKKLENNVESSVLALMKKADVYFAMSNYPGARKVLKRAFKLRTPICDDRKDVETALKRAIILCDLEKDLVATSSDLLLERKKLYEKFGDACCSVKNYVHAIKCYINMLECAHALGETGMQLLPCYVSLSQTYRDNKSYDLALEYARKELEISKNVPIEAAKTHLNVGEILEIKGASYEEISDEYLAALRNAKAAKSDKLRALSLGRLLSVQKAHGRMDVAKKSECELKEIEDVDSSDSEAEPNPEDDVHLSELSASEEDIPRASRSTFKLTRNEKGETPLHVAAIKGDVSRARRLVSMGHPVKERDLAGWTPLHEAANHGHLEMVKLLVEAGADVNDPGGKDCGGVTPLHDSACCGHFEVIRYLMDNGATLTMLTNDGDTPLDCLNGWRKRVDDLDEESQKRYDELARDLRVSLTAAGVQRKEPTSFTFQKKHSQERCSESRREARKTKFARVKDRLGGLRRHIDIEEVDRRSIARSVSPISSDSNHDVDDLPSVVQKGGKENNPPMHGSSVSDYRSAMSTIRKRPVPIELHKPSIDAPLLDEDEYVEEWLDDDLGVCRNQKKNKRKIVELIERSNTREKRSTEREDIPGAAEDQEERASPSDGNLRKKTKLQATRDYVENMEVETPVLSSHVPDRSFEFPCESPPSSSVSTCAARSAATKVRVKVGEHLLLLLIDTSRAEDLTVSWLAQEAAKRYYSLEGSEPKIQITTRDGALLDPSDPLTLALGEELIGKIVSWKTIALSERYRFTCSADPVEGESWCGGSRLRYIKGLTSKLDACDSSRHLNLKNLALDECELKPVIQSLRSERSLRTVDLTGNLLGDDGLTFLARSLKNCAVENLILRCTNVTENGISQFSDALHSMSQEFLTALRNLDLSFNPLGDKGVEVTQRISSLLPNLSTLKTDQCHFPF